MAIVNKLCEDCGHPLKVDTVARTVTDAVTGSTTCTVVKGGTESNMHRFAPEVHPTLGQFARA